MQIELTEQNKHDLISLIKAIVLLLVLYYLSIVYADYSNKEMAVIKVNEEYKHLLVGMKCQNDNGLCLIQGNLINCSIIKMLNQTK